MANETNIWQDVDGNWTNTANWSRGSAPAATEHVYILDGTQDIETNVDQNTTDLSSLRIGSQFTGDIGKSGGPLKIGAAEVLVAGGGEVWLQGKTGVDLPLVNVDKAQWTDNSVVLAGFIGEVNVYRGRVEIAAGVDTDATLRFRALWKTRRDSDAYLVIGTPTAVITSVTLLGGRVTGSLGITTVNLHGGHFSQTAGNLATLYIYDGLCSWTSSGTIKDAWAFGGVFDARKNKDKSGPPTITTLRQFPGAVVDLRTEADNITVTNTETYACKGPLLGLEI